MLERRTSTLPHTLNQSEKSTQKTIRTAQWNETIKIRNTLGGPPIRTANRNHHETTQDLLDENDREEETMPQE